MAGIAVTVNGVARTLSSPPGTPLLWVLRDELGLTGTKYGCGEGLCGSCTVLLDGSPVRSCTVSLGEAAGRTVVTIEGLSKGCDHPLQRAWLEEEVPQCGYCQSGQLMTAASLLAKNPNPSEEQINAAMEGVLCRCGTYGRIKRAIQRVARGAGR